MLHIKHSNITSYFSARAFLTTVLFCSLTCTPALADNKKYFRKEPIFPIPQLVLVNIEMADLGEKLFNDTRLSRDNQVACSSCHQLKSGGDDNLPLGISLSNTQHVINTPTIFNAQFNFRQNWDGSAKNLPEQIDGVVRSHHEFNSNWNDIIDRLTSDTELTAEFHDIFSSGINRQTIIDALVEFEKTLITPNAPFDKYLKNEEHRLTQDEINGYKMFKELGCVSCHQGINLGGNLYQKFGVFYNYIAERGDIKKTDYGRMNITDRYVDAFVFKVPSLRNIAVTGPYLHDGSAETLEEAISIMGRTQLGRTLSTEEIRLIKSFLYTLTGEYNNTSLTETSLEEEL